MVRACEERVHGIKKNGRCADTKKETEECKENQVERLV